jgi:hypothetical protein
MSYRTLDIASGANGGAIKLANDPGRARNIHITVLNPTANAHAAFFGRSRRELTTPGPVGIAGFALPVPSNASTVFAPGQGVVGGVSYISFLLQGWTGELWAAADVTALIQVDIFEGSTPEK